MKIRIENEFHNVDVETYCKGEFSNEKAARLHRKYSCNHQDCECASKITMIERGFTFTWDLADGDWGIVQ